MSAAFSIDRDEISSLCRRFGVRRLVLFGSAVSGRFDADRSDVDFLVEFDPDLPSHFEAYFGLKEALEGLFGRPVDLVEPPALENPFFAASVERTGQELYAA
jgi:uncharacterized protein